MAELAIAGSTNLAIRGKATNLTMGLKHKDFMGEACALLDYVNGDIRYVRDIYGIETLHTAETIMDRACGDCDDKSILLAALLLSIGHLPRFIAVAPDGIQFSHVWVQDLINGNWVDLEPTEPIPCGQRVPLPANTQMIYLVLG